jgi:hypothetical protein
LPGSGSLWYSGCQTAFAVVIAHYRQFRLLHTRIQLLLNMKSILIRYKKPIVITAGITILNILYGFDPRFTIINLLWLLV